jgi:hypothetical protein
LRQSTGDLIASIRFLQQAARGDCDGTRCRLSDNTSAGGAYAGYGFIAGQLFERSGA